MMSLDTIKRLIESLTLSTAGQELVGVIGSRGGFQLNSDGTIRSVSGDLSVLPDSGGGAGTYRVVFPSVNAQIQSIPWFNVTGFTPRVPTAAETAQPMVTGYNFDPTLKQWYITVQIAPIGGGASELPPAGFVVAVSASFALKPTAYPL